MSATGLIAPQAWRDPWTDLKPLCAENAKILAFKEMGLELEALTLETSWL